jgi:hypothetical protein
MFKAATVLLKEPFSLNSGRKFAEALVQKLGKQPDACWLYCSPELGMEDLLAGICAVIETPNLIGCTTDGEISDMGLTSGSAVLGGFFSDRIACRVVSAENIDKDGEQVGKELAAKLPESVQYIQLLSDGLTGNGCALLRGMVSVLGEAVPIVGGTAGDAGKFIQTWQFIGNRVLTNSAVAIGFTGEFKASEGIQAGWSPVGLPKKVTRAAGNILYELNGESALEVFKRFLGKHAEGLPAVGVEYPLGIIRQCTDGVDANYYQLRATMSVDHDDGSLRFAGEIPEGSMVHLTCGDISSILEATRKAVAIAREGLGGTPPGMVFYYGCMARKKVLGLRTKDEYALIRKGFGRDVPILGFYTYGEFCRVGCGGPCLLHNETAVVSVIGC